MDVHLHQGTEVKVTPGIHRILLLIQDCLWTHQSTEQTTSDRDSTTGEMLYDKVYDDPNNTFSSTLTLHPIQAEPGTNINQVKVECVQPTKLNQTQDDIQTDGPVDCQQKIPLELTQETPGFSSDIVGNDSDGGAALKRVRKCSICYASVQHIIFCMSYILWFC